MRDYVDELRQKPKTVRAQVAFVAAATVTGVVFLGWAYNLSDRLAVAPTDPAVAAYQAERERDLQPEAAAGGLGSVLGRLQRGAAALIFNDANEEQPDDEMGAKTIDIEALLKNPPTRAETDDRVVPAQEVPATGENSGSVILIGTTTRTTENIE